MRHLVVPGDGLGGGRLVGCEDDVADDMRGGGVRELQTAHSASVWGIRLGVTGCSHSCALQRRPCTADSPCPGLPEASVTRRHASGRHVSRGRQRLKQTPTHTDNITHSTRGIAAERLQMHMGAAGLVWGSRRAAGLLRPLLRSAPPSPRETLRSVRPRARAQHAAPQRVAAV